MTDGAEIKNILGLKVKELRLKKGITQEKLAEFLDVQTQTISKIEAGKIFISSDSLANFCNFFNVEPYVFFVDPGTKFTPKETNQIEEINSKLKEIHNILIRTKK